MNEYSILFLDMHHGFLSRLAQKLAQNYAPSMVSCFSAGVSPAPLSPGEITALEKQGITTMQPASVYEIAGQFFNVVVTIGKEAHKQTPMLAGVPPIIHWNIEEPIEIADQKAYDLAAELLENSIKIFFAHGYAGALVNQRIYLDNLLDSLNEGIIAHDLNRKIFYVNKGAERILGVDRLSVLGKNCHEIFMPHFCGNNCAFCEASDYTALTKAKYDTVYLPENNSRKEFEVVRTPLRNDEGIVFGAIATFTDVTQVHELEKKVHKTAKFSGIIGQDHKMLAIYDLIRDLSTSDFSVVITGESGTGKELVAAAIHNESLRRDRLFVPINCGALPEGTLESELFGHVKGAFTGAIRDKRGRFELADKGTLFLDEVAEMPLKLQVKLLRVLQEGVFEPVGSEVSKKVDVRIIAATNKNLKEMVTKGTFRDDLYYRLSVVPIELPPLRDRKNDIPLLVREILNDLKVKMSRESLSVDDDALAVLLNYSWPGNVRQLQNCLQFALIRCKGSTILPEHLPSEILNAVPLFTFAQLKEPGKAGRKPKLTVDIVESALTKAGGNKAKAARILGVGRATLYNFITEHKEIVAE